MPWGFGFAPFSGVCGFVDRKKHGVFGWHLLNSLGPALQPKVQGFRLFFSPPSDKNGRTTPQTQRWTDMNNRYEESSILRFIQLGRDGENPHRQWFPGRMILQAASSHSSHPDVRVPAVQGQATTLAESAAAAPPRAFVVVQHLQHLRGICRWALDTGPVRLSWNKKLSKENQDTVFFLWVLGSSIYLNDILCRILYLFGEGAADIPIHCICHFISS